MNVFGIKFLEPMQKDGELKDQQWSWTPKGENASQIYASGNCTRSRSSTYAAETDNRQDEDRPNEGLAA